jgi:hypothetical protein
MTTRLQQIRDGIIEALNQRGAPTKATKRRWSPDQELEADEVRAAVLFHRERTERVGGPGSTTKKRDHTIAVQAVTAVSDPADIDDALEVYRDWMVAQLGDNKLGGLVHEIDEGETSWETAKLERIHGAFTTLWRVQYQTRVDDLSEPH